MKSLREKQIGPRSMEELCCDTGEDKAPHRLPPLIRLSPDRAIAGRIRGLPTLEWRSGATI